MLHYNLGSGLPGFSVHHTDELGSALCHRPRELVLLRAGDGHEPLHLGLVGLVPRLVFLVEHGHDLKLLLLDLLLESA